METKKLYQFTLDKEVEKIVESTRKNKKTGEETITKKKVKKKEPIEVQIKRPNRRELEEAELEYSIEMSKCIKKGILTKAMLGKKYSDTGGLFSEDDSNNYADMYKDALDLQNEYVRLETVKKRTKTQETRFDKLKGEVAANRKEIIDFESNFPILVRSYSRCKSSEQSVALVLSSLDFMFMMKREISLSNILKAKTSKRKSNLTTTLKRLMILSIGI